MLLRKKALLVCSQHARKGKNTSPIRNLEKHCGDFENLITEKYGYKSESTTVLLDSKRNMNNDRLAHLRPTRDNIIHEISKLAKYARSGDQLLILLSGHGCRVPSQSTNANQDERVYEALVPCDGKVTKDGSYAPKTLVSYDEICELLTRALVKGARVIVILDTCHSGAAMAFPDFGYNRLHSPQKTDPQMKDAAGEKEHVVLGEDVQPLLPPYSEIRNDPIPQNVISISSFLISYVDPVDLVEVARGVSVTQALVEALGKDPQPTYRSLLEAMSRLLDEQAQELAKFYYIRKKYRERKGDLAFLMSSEVASLKRSYYLSIVESAENKSEDEWEEFVLNCEPTWKPQIGSQNVLNLDDKFLL
ncbi:hypothetical protein SCHPADRAFT_907491 [Schizopora paradoxa]|uniref:Peptidase C14 caspase domain-containing protein n=1 Tax=Schizopora paradoxa TaxID=27342 RepID=A0A0H2RD33_9AGAM|nr:hypothetical protein SCHPADRAFT_907491 [Schizopora paradoxa]